jgi:hypothetical protein
LLEEHDFLKSDKASTVRLLRVFLITIAKVVIRPSPFQPGIKNSEGLNEVSLESHAFSSISSKDEVEKAFSWINEDPEFSLLLAKRFNSNP